MPTGETSGLVVLDVDNKNGSNGFESLSQIFGQDIPNTFSTTTPNNGQHLYFRYCGSLRNRTGFLPGLDFRSGGGFVVVPPSIIDGSPYSYSNCERVLELPPALLEALSTSNLRSQSVPAVSYQTIGQGERNNSAFNLALRLRRSGLDQRTVQAQVATFAAGCSPPLPPSEVIRCVESAYNYDIESDLTELRLCEMFAHSMSDTLRCASGSQWYLRQGFLWRKAELHSVEMKVKEFIRSFETVDSQSSKMKKWMESAERIKNVIKLARSEESLAVDVDDLDSDPFLLGVANGVLDLRNGELLQQDAESLITKRTPVDFVPNAECPRFEEFLSQLFSSNAEIIDYIQRVFGYLLTGDTSEQVLFYLHGSGANGKSTLVDVLNQLLGEYSIGVDAGKFSLTSRSYEAEVARMPGVRLVTTQEIGLGKLNESLIKELTGEQRVTARELYKASFDFQPQMKLVFQSNYPPQIVGVDNGIWRRIQAIRFEAEFIGQSADASLKNSLRAELSGILNWALVGYQQWRMEGLRYPAVWDGNLIAYRNSGDVVGAWIRARCRESVGKKTQLQALRSDFEDYCQRQDVEEAPSLGTKDFSNRGYRTGRNSKGIYVSDICVRRRRIRQQPSSDM